MIIQHLKIYNLIVLTWFNGLDLQWPDDFCQILAVSASGERSYILVSLN